MSCTRDVSRVPRMVTGNEAVIQALFRRLITPRGRLPEDLSYGTCVEDWLGETVTAADITSLRQAITAECLKEPEVRRVQVETDWSPATRTLRIRITAIGPDGSFSFTASTTDGTGLVLE